jgi:hypothetical protein
MTNSSSSGERHFSNPILTTETIYTLRSIAVKHPAETLNFNLLECLSIANTEWGVKKAPIYPPEVVFFRRNSSGAQKWGAYGSVESIPLMGHHFI